MLRWRFFWKYLWLTPVRELIAHTNLKQAKRSEAMIRDVGYAIFAGAEQATFARHF